MLPNTLPARLYVMLFGNDTGRPTSQPNMRSRHVVGGTSGSFAELQVLPVPVVTARVAGDTCVTKFALVPLTDVREIEPRPSLIVVGRRVREASSAEPGNGDDELGLTE